MRLRLATVAIAVLLAATASAEDSGQKKAFDVLGYMMVGTAAADVLSTHYAIRGGASEANPVLPDGIAGIAATRAAVTTLSWYGTDQLYRMGHERVGLGLRILTVGLAGYVTLHNLRVGAQARTQ